VALSLTVRVADRAPEAPGVNVTLTRHMPSALIVPDVGQVVADDSLKSAAFVPLIAMPVMFSPKVELVSVKVEAIAALVAPTFTDPKFKVEGNKVAISPLELFPVPVRLTICGLVASASVKVRVPVNVP
jgi:hypothetical protein